MFGWDDYDEMAGEHFELRKRIRKSLYYSYMPVETCTSLPLTEWAVEFLQDAAPRKLGRVDTYFASAVARESCISPCSMMLGMLYIERLKHKNSDYLQTVSSSDLFLISMMMATKYLQDEGVDEEVYNDEWAESCDMDINELNNLEKEFLSAMDWELFVSRNDFNKQLDSVERKIALCEGFKRGWFTYSDLYVLMNDPKFSRLLLDVGRDVREMLIAGSVAYLAGFLTIVGSTVLMSCISTNLPASTLLQSPQLSLQNDAYTTNQLPINSKMPPDVNEDVDVPSDIEADEILVSTECKKETESKSSLSGIVRRFWALLMLKDTLVNLISTQQMSCYCRRKEPNTTPENSSKTFPHERSCKIGACIQSNQTTKPLPQSKKPAESSNKNCQTDRLFSNQWTNCSNEYPSTLVFSTTCKVQSRSTHVGEHLYHRLNKFQKVVKAPCVGPGSWFDTEHSSCQPPDVLRHFSSGLSYQIHVMT